MSQHERGPSPGGCLSIDAIVGIASGAEAGVDESAHLSTCSLCRDVLEQARRDGALERELAAAVGTPAGSGASSTPAGAGRLGVGTRLGAFTITGELGVGGMGVVYRAEQDAPRREVALKLIKAEMVSQSLLRRFEHEAAALALLQHPGIAQVYQSGTAMVGGGPRPYMAMELVRGTPLDTYLSERKPAMAETIRLLVLICEAADHAHRRGVVHRDLKPANILVSDEGAIKILDFGVAKFTEQAPGAGAALGATQPDAFVGTLAYASPEQVAGDPSLIDAGTDVYAIGLIAYRALTGRHAYALDGPLGEVIDTIRAARITDPHAAMPRMHADLALILRTALAADPARRYASAALLAEDLRRFLEKRPIRARPDSSLYVLQRAVARNPWAAVAAGTLVLAMIGAGVLALRAARAERAKAGVVDATWEALALTDPDEPDTPLVTSLGGYLRDSREIVEKRLAEHPEERDLMVTRLGRAMRGQRELAAAAEVFEQVLARRSQRGEQDTLRIADAHLELGQTLYLQGKYEQAHDHMLTSVAIRERRLGAGHKDSADARYWLGASLHGWKRYEDAEREFRAAIDVRRSIEPDSLEIGEYLTALAAAVRGRGRYEEALAHAREALAHVHRVKGKDSKFAAPALSNVIANLISLKRFDQVEENLNEALRLRTQWYGPDDPRVADTLVQFASFERRRAGTLTDPAQDAARRRSIESGVSYAQRALELRRRVHAGDHESVAEAISLIGQLRMMQGRLDDAIASLTEALEMRRRLPRQSDGDLGRSEVNLGECLMRAGRESDRDRALELLRTGLDRLRNNYGPEHQFTAHGARTLAELFTMMGRADEAARVMQTYPAASRVQP